MTRWARLSDEGRIVEVTDIDPEGRFSPDIVWTVVDDDAMPGAIQDENGHWVGATTPSDPQTPPPPDPPPLPDAEAAERELAKSYLQCLESGGFLQPGAVSRLFP